MSNDDFGLLGPHLERIPLGQGDRIAAAGEAVDHVCFPENAVTSIADIFSDGSRTEIGVIGYEGMTNWSVLVGGAQTPHEAVVQVGGGWSLRISTEHLFDACGQSPAIRGLLLAFVETFMVQMGRTLASNLRDPIERRLSRWLLMCHDRLDGDEINLTHAYIGTMLGVRRASVTDSLHVLEGEGAIRNARSRILVRDRERLEALAGEAYGHAEAHYRKRIAAFGKSGGQTLAVPPCDGSI